MLVIGPRWETSGGNWGSLAMNTASPRVQGDERGESVDARECREKAFVGDRAVSGAGNLAHDTSSRMT